MPRPRWFNPYDDTFEYSPSGASKTCRHCGTIYDLHAVDISDYCPPVGDGCKHCNERV